MNAPQSHPLFDVGGTSLLDVGCGTGWKLAAYQHPIRCGVDPDENAVRAARAKYPHISFVVGSAEALPFPDAHFDAVTAFISLPYTDIRRALEEIARVLTPGGEVILTLHYWSLHFKWLREAIRTRAWKRVLDLIFVTAASGVYALSGMVPRKPQGGRETVQSAFRIRHQLSSAGFSSIETGMNGRHWVVRAAKKN
jgi:ubiquinone/menaquinone biosynthesis C-methylase UbiE